MQVLTPISYPDGGPLPMLHLQERQYQGTDAGSASAGVQIRQLNTVVEPKSGVAWATTTSLPQITLQPGRYRVYATAPAVAVQGHRLELQFTPVPDPPPIHPQDNLLGPSGKALSAYSYAALDRATLYGEFTLVDAYVVELAHFTENSRLVDGLGRAVDYGGAEIYSEMVIWRVADA